MRKYVLWVWTIVSVLLVLPGCAKPTGIEVDLGKEFTLSIGQSAAVAGEDLSVKFVEVVSDSRCPQGATCIWAGEASCLIEVTSSGSTYRKLLTQSGNSGPSQTDFLKYEITFDLEPYPQVGRETKEGDYRLQLVFNSAPSTGTIVDNGSLIVGEIKAVTSMSTGYPWELEVLVKSVQNVDSLPNPVSDKVGQVISCRTDENASAFKVGQLITANVKLTGDVERGTLLYIYNIK